MNSTDFGDPLKFSLGKTMRVHICGLSLMIFPPATAILCFESNVQMLDDVVKKPSTVNHVPVS